MMFTAKVLIVEDEDEIANGYEKAFDSSRVGPYGDVEFLIDKARYVDEARRKIQAFRPYDIVVLDLGLPRTENDYMLKKDVPRWDWINSFGLEVLKDLQPEDYTAVIIISGKLDTVNIVEAYRLGALDVLRKPASKDEVLMAAVKAWEKAWMQSRVEKMGNRLDLAIRHSREDAYDQFSKLVTNQSSAICGLVDSLSALLKDRFLLDSLQDSNDPIVKKIHALKETSRSMSAKILDFRSTEESQDANDNYGEVDLEQLLKEVKRRLGPAWIAHNLNIPESFPALKIFTFKHELQLIIEELVLGAVGTYASPKQQLYFPFPTHGVNITVDPVFKDHLAKLKIENYSMGQAPDFQGDTAPATAHKPMNRRYFGLEMAKRLARDIGIDLQEATGKGRSSVTLSIPLSEHG